MLELRLQKNSALPTGQQKAASAHAWTTTTQNTLTTEDQLKDKTTQWTRRWGPKLALDNEDVQM